MKYWRILKAYSHKFIDLESWMDIVRYVGGNFSEEEDIFFKELMLDEWEEEDA
jgi:hypothetical protein